MSDKKDHGRRKRQELKRLAVGYARVSTASQGESGISLDAQRVAIEKFAEAMGYHLIDTFRDVASGVGASSFDKRPGLKSALDVASRNNADLLVWDWDRLSRHAGFEKQIKEVLDDPDRITCVKQGTKLKNASRDATFAHDERVAREISRTTKEGMQRKRAEGATFGNPEIGSKIQPLGAATWSKNSDEHVRKIADVLREMDDHENATYGDIAQILNAIGLRTLHGKPWTSQRARIPVKKARELLRKEEEQTMQSQPNYGMF